MSIFLQVLLTGIAMGFIYALVGIEYTIIWNATGMSDRVYVMKDGAVVAEIKDKQDMDQEKILSYTIGQK